MLNKYGFIVRIVNLRYSQPANRMVCISRPNSTSSMPNGNSGNWIYFSRNSHGSLAAAKASANEYMRNYHKIVHDQNAGDSFTL
jgi:hypothetical protein